MKVEESEDLNKNLDGQDRKYVLMTDMIDGTLYDRKIYTKEEIISMVDTDGVIEKIGAHFEFLAQLFGENDISFEDLYFYGGLGMATSVEALDRSVIEKKGVTNYLKGNVLDDIVTVNLCCSDVSEDYSGVYDHMINSSGIQAVFGVVNYSEFMKKMNELGYDIKGQDKGDFDLFVDRVSSDPLSNSLIDIHAPLERKLSSVEETVGGFHI